MYCKMCLLTICYAYTKHIKYSNYVSYTKVQLTCYSHLSNTQVTHWQHSSDVRALNLLDCHTWLVTNNQSLFPGLIIKYQ